MSVEWCRFQVSDCAVLPICKQLLAKTVAFLSLLFILHAIINKFKFSLHLLFYCTHFLLHVKEHYKRHYKYGYRVILCCYYFSFGLCYINLLCLAILFCVILFFVFVSPIYEFAADKLYQQVYKIGSLANRNCCTVELLLIIRL